MAASCKEAKYATLRTHYDFQPIAVETLGPINESATYFLHDLGRRISFVSGEDREPQFLFQRISVAIQRFNAVLLHDGFFVFRPPGLVLLQSLILFIIFFLPREYTYRGLKNNNKSQPIAVETRPN